MRPSLARPISRNRALAVTAMAGALAVTAACGSAAAPAARSVPSASSAAHHPMPSPDHTMAQAAPFGPECAMVPATGMGSFHGMSMDPFVTAAAHDPLLATFAAKVKTAGLATELNSMRGFTVFAPASTAFSKLPAAEMTMMHSAAELARTLKYHVVAGHVTTAELASGKPLTTLEGSSLRPAKMGAVYEVNNAQVICGNIPTANATVYVINKVLVPAR